MKGLCFLGRLAYQLIHSHYELCLVSPLMTFISHQVLKYVEKNFKNGQALAATVTNSDITETKLCLSLTGML